jgi:hypothetical protein
MTDREALLKKAQEFEVVLNTEDDRLDKIYEIRESLSKNEMNKVEDEARVRAMHQLEKYEEEYRTADRYASRKSLFINQVIGEWYIDQKKPLEARTVEQVEA